MLIRYLVTTFELPNARFYSDYIKIQLEVFKNRIVHISNLTNGRATVDYGYDLLVGNEVNYRE